MALFLLVLISFLFFAEAKIGNLINTCPLQPLADDKLSFIMCMPFPGGSWGEGDRVRYTVWLPAGIPDWSITLMSSTFQPVFEAKMNGRIAKYGYWSGPWGTGKYKEPAADIIQTYPLQEGKVWIELMNGYKGVEVQMGAGSTLAIFRIVPHIVNNTATDYKYLKLTRPTIDSNFLVSYFTDMKESFKMATITDKLFNLVDRIL